MIDNKDWYSYQSNKELMMVKSKCSLESFPRKFFQFGLLLFCLALISGCGDSNNADSAANVSDDSVSDSSTSDNENTSFTMPNMSIAAVGDSEVRISWPASVGANSYNLYYANESFSGLSNVENYASLTGGTLLSGLTDTYYDVTGLANSSAYYFVLTAIQEGGESLPSDEVSATPNVVKLLKGTQPLNDTGITFSGSSYSGNSSDCTSDISALQDCDLGRDVLVQQADKVGGGRAGFDFTRINYDGSEYSGSGDYLIEPWGCVQDNLTGLIWEVKTDDSGLHDKDDRYQWTNSDPMTNGGYLGSVDNYSNLDWCYAFDNADGTLDCNTSKFVQLVNAATLCGYSDWRMPSRDELVDIVDFGRSQPSIDIDYFPNTQAGSYFSANPSSRKDFSVWAVDFYDGNSTLIGKPPFTATVWARLVRDGK